MSEHGFTTAQLVMVIHIRDFAVSLGYNVNAEVSLVARSPVAKLLPTSSTYK